MLYYKSSFVTILLTLLGSMIIDVTYCDPENDYKQCIALMEQFCDSKSLTFMECAKGAFFKYKQNAAAPDYMHNYFKLIYDHIFTGGVLPPWNYCRNPVLYQSEGFANAYPNLVWIMNKYGTKGELRERTDGESSSIGSKVDAMIVFRIEEKCIADLEDFQRQSSVFEYAFMHIDEDSLVDRVFAQIYLKVMSESIYSNNYIRLSTPYEMCFINNLPKETVNL